MFMSEPMMVRFQSGIWSFAVSCPWLILCKVVDQDMNMSITNNEQSMTILPIPVGSQSVTQFSKQYLYF